MLPVVPGLPSQSSPSTAAVRRPRHAQPVDAETEHRGWIRFIEFRVLMYTQLAVINSQHLLDFDTVALKNGPHIRICWSAKCGKTYWLLGKSRDQRWFHHEKSCVLSCLWCPWTKAFMIITITGARSWRALSERASRSPSGHSWQLFLDASPYEPLTFLEQKKGRKNDPPAVYFWVRATSPKNTRFF